MWSIQEWNCSQYPNSIHNLTIEDVNKKLLKCVLHPLQHLDYKWSNLLPEKKQGPSILPFCTRFIFTSL